MSVVSLRVISRKEVAQHDDMSSGWIILHNFVYDITDFLLSDAHPGSTEILLEYSTSVSPTTTSINFNDTLELIRPIFQIGSDASSVFEDCGHSRHARRLVQKYLIGILPEGECAGHNSEYLAYSQHISMATPLIA
ncbi:hypothetical protein PRIPAC_70271 [Pristionchus pacificus]|uniref:Cytochrome b5 heme-binding domain-containing protein n=1 Tax=Pristionchus pacificus TaxID=54126 RepID=A0A2A6C1S3_PRIPA|nr:hypothetical protein PRIPAC_70271 [Pristionchus pacificus]|eukprot:PDM71973.1 hypothetical protein PRIPAC_38380 [Pristionchus pacificus]